MSHRHSERSEKSIFQPSPIGDSNYYQRFGFTSCKDLKHEGVPPENLLALAFNTPTPNGTVEFHPAFFTEE